MATYDDYCAMDANELSALLDKYNNEKEALMLRMASLTDPIVIEQERETYERMEWNIANVMAVLESKLDMICDEKKDTIGNIPDFDRENDLVAALCKTNKLEYGEINVMLRDGRFRVPVSIKDRRRLVILSDILRHPIDILDIHGSVVDSICGPSVKNTTPYILRTDYEVFFV